MIGPRPDCLDCKYYHKENHDGFTCDAFPREIPDNILMGEIKHTKPLPSQNNDIVFEAAEEYKK